MVVGGLRYAALVDHYMPGHPPVCEPDDDVMIDLYRERIKRHGALLIDREPADLEEFIKRAGIPVKLEKRRVKYRSRFGRTRSSEFVLGFLPPGPVVK